MVSTLSSRVAAGAKFLDCHCRGWHLKIAALRSGDLVTWHPRLNTLGVLFGDHFEGLGQLQIDRAESIDLGFEIDFSDGPSVWSALAIHWMREASHRVPSRAPRAMRDRALAGVGG